MRINSTELQNNFGKYLLLAANEDIVITRNGTEIARLTTSVKHSDVPQRVNENLPVFGYGEKATYHEFLQLRKESDERVEYIDGEIYLLASPKVSHQYAVGQLHATFSNFFAENECTPFVAPFDIELKRPSTEEMNMVQPDLMVICDLEKHLGEDDYYKGVPSLVVEVLSESTRKKDLILKLDLYMSCGVEEYWVVNPDNKEVTVYHFEGQDIEAFKTYKNDENACSYIFNRLKADLSYVFRS
ncbi:type II toxin-antitoxin system prevent-host-death family antitoxin [Aquisalibacillus elongatus]|uniref:Prevent-host-death family protein n=1 Tax=Aquisalibacillus elongatus TaxID=485577 RepID=A0A3N5BEB8_9BACI|nr:type II toxin-antitoxin system prevent-host-death family antitoxin [Aquisalibacillus elongatus]RPF55249.1 prevent-host-death family protein [Aquisalibacillus elongatus]